jgi:hypothetical protein
MVVTFKLCDKHRSYRCHNEDTYNITPFAWSRIQYHNFHVVPGEYVLAIRGENLSAVRGLIAAILIDDQVVGTLNL